VIGIPPSGHPGVDHVNPRLAQVARLVDNASDGLNRYTEKGSANLAQPQPEPRDDASDEHDDLLGGIDGAELFTPVDINGDLRAAMRRAAQLEERLVVRDGGEELVAILPLADIRFLLRLKNAELDRIDLEEVRKARADPDDQDRILLDAIRAELAL
jgi:hypothetical protein